MNQFFNLLKDSGTQAMLVLVGTVAACTAAILAFYYGRKSLTKTDLKGLEDNTAATSGHLENVHQSLKAQEERDALPSKVDALHFGVSGECVQSDPLPIKVTVSDGSVVVIRMELFVRNGTYFGTAECSRTGDREYVSPLAPQKLAELSVACVGFPKAPRIQLRLRICFDLAGHEQYRDCPIAIYAINVFGVQPKGTFPGWQIEGSV